MKPIKRAKYYQIKIAGILDERWWRWYEDLEISISDEGHTLLCGVMDQPALHGLLNRIRDTGTELISIERVDIEETETKN